MNNSWNRGYSVEEVRCTAAPEAALERHWIRKLENFFYFWLSVRSGIPDTKNFEWPAIDQFSILTQFDYEFEFFYYQISHNRQIFSPKNGLILWSGCFFFALIVRTLTSKIFSLIRSILFTFTLKCKDFNLRFFLKCEHHLYQRKIESTLIWAIYLI